MRGEKSGNRYSYDPLGRLLRVEQGIADLDTPDTIPERSLEYSLTPAGRRKMITRTVGGSTVTEMPQTDARGAFTVLLDTSYRYDANGNRVEEIKGSGRTCQTTYDFADRPLEIVRRDQDGNKTRSVRYRYDSLGRVLVRTADEDGDVTTTRRSWNGFQLIAEERENGSGARSWVYGSRIDQPIALNVEVPDAEELYAYGVDGRGFTRVLVGATGPKERFGYGPQLEVESLDPQNLAALGPLGEVRSTLQNPFFLPGGIHDPIAQHFQGLGSEFDPLTGQFTNPGQACGGPDGNVAPAARWLLGSGSQPDGRYGARME